jgi:hypothetical protein
MKRYTPSLMIMNVLKESPFPSKGRLSVTMISFLGCGLKLKIQLSLRGDIARKEEIFEDGMAI